MGLQINHEKRLRGYLLGELPLQEQKLLEEHLVADDDSFQQLLFVEEELIDDYLNGELSAPERARFESHFLAAPERQQDLRFAKALRKYVATTTALSQQSPDSSSSWFSRLSAFFASRKPAIAFSFVLALLVIGGFWLVRRTQEEERASLQPQPLQTQTPPPALAQKSPEPDVQAINVNQGAINNQANSEVSVNNRPPNLETPTNSGQPKRSVFKVILASGLTRGDGGAKTVRIPRNTTTARLLMEVDPAANDYQSYSAVLQTASREKILSKSKLRARATPSGKIVIWEIPAKLLKREDYYLKLSGRNAAGQFEPVGTYDFRVIE